MRHDEIRVGEYYAVNARDSRLPRRRVQVVKNLGKDPAQSAGIPRVRFIVRDVASGNEFQLTSAGIYPVDTVGQTHSQAGGMPRGISGRRRLGGEVRRVEGQRIHVTLDLRMPLEDLTTVLMLLRDYSPVMKQIGAP